MDAPDLETSLDDTAGVLDGILHSHRPEIRVDDVGTVSFVGQGIVRVTGLRGVNRKNSSPLRTVFSEWPLTWTRRKPGSSCWTKARRFSRGVKPGGRAG
jgi:hypothetical protein